MRDMCIAFIALHMVSLSQRMLYTLSPYHSARRLWTCITNELFFVMLRAYVFPLPLSYPRRNPKAQGQTLRRGKATSALLQDGDQYQQRKPNAGYTCTEYFSGGPTGPQRDARCGNASPPRAKLARE